MQSPASVDSLRSALHLPPHWAAQSVGLCKVEGRHNCGSEVTRCITVESDFTWKVYAHGREIDPRSCSAINHISDKLDSMSLQLLVDTVDRCTVCPGNCEHQFVSLLEERKGSIKSTNGSISAYLDQSLPFLDPVAGETCHTTVRSSQCTLFTDSNSKCEMCRAYRKNLRAMVSRSTRVSSPEKRMRVDSSSHTNYRYLHSPELTQRLHNSMTQNKILSRRVQQLKMKIEETVQSSGIILDDRLNSDMCTIVTDNNNSINHPPDSFAGLFWDQQRESMRKNPKQMRWHPMMIKWCMHLKMLSSACYNSLRSSGVLKLPSQRTLRDYTNVLKARSGLHRDVDEQLLKEAEIDDGAEDCKKLVALLFDEVKIKEDLVYNKHTGEVIGFVDITDINQHLSAYEQSCSEESCKPKLATHMLVFMVRGICSKLEYPYAQFPVSTASGDILHPIVWECVEHLEMIGLKVLSFVCDGASCNRKFYKMHKIANGVNYKVKNVYADEDRPIFLISDIPHLMKTARNSWANSYAHSNSKQLWVCFSY